MSEGVSARYVMGHNDRERRRLALQGSIINPITEQLLRRAGISGGMHVLDIGCGVGDVSMIAARLVGRDGRVAAVDIDQEALSIAEGRAQAQGLANISFVQSNIDEYRTDHPLDAVLGRHILIHTTDPLKVLQNAWLNLREGGVAVFQEFDFAATHLAYPAWPLRERVMKVFRDFFCHALAGDMGTRLYHLFLEAGFTAPDCRAEFSIDGGPNSPCYEWVAEALRSIFPRAEKLGMTQNLNVDLDTLADRLKEEAVALKACVPAPLMVGGFARKR